MAHAFPLVIVILLLLLVSRVAGEILERFGQMAMIGEIAAGVVLGPSLLHWIEPTRELKVVSDLGVFLLVMLAGMELDFADLASAFRGRGAFIALLGFFVPFGSGVAIGPYLGFDRTTSLFVGLCIAITALPVAVRVLMDLGRLHTDTGQRIIAAAVFNDVTALLLLGIVLSIERGGNLAASALTAAGKSLAFLSIVFVVHRIVRYSSGHIPHSRRVVAWAEQNLRGREGLFAMTLMFVLAFAGLAELIGLHFVVGAFFGAMVLSHRVLGNANYEKVESTASGMTMGFLAPIFFAAIGLDFRVASLSNGVVVLAILVLAFATKLIGGYAGGRIAGLDNRCSWVIGIGLNGRGIMELVIAELALNAGFIDEALFSTVVLMGIVTTVVTPVLLKRAYAASAALEAEVEHPLDVPPSVIVEGPTSPLPRGHAA